MFASGWDCFADACHNKNNKQQQTFDSTAENTQVIGSWPSVGHSKIA